MPIPKSQENSIQFLNVGKTGIWVEVFKIPLFHKLFKSYVSSLRKIISLWLDRLKHFFSNLRRRNLWGVTVPKFEFQTLKAFRIDTF